MGQNKTEIEVKKNEHTQKRARSMSTSHFDRTDSAERTFFLRDQSGKYRVNKMSPYCPLG